MTTNIGKIAALLDLTDRMTNKLELAASNVERTGRRMQVAGKRMRQVGGSLSRHVTLPLLAASAAALKFGNDFSMSMTKIETLVGVNRKTVDAWKKDILELSGRVAKSPRELAEAMFFVTSAGQRGAVALETLTASAEASAIGLGAAATVADAATSAMNAYGVENLKASEAVNTLALAVRAGKLEASQLAPVLGRLLPTASSLNIAFQDVAGVLAVMSRTGLDAAEASTSLNQIMSTMLKPTSGAAKILGEVGLSMGQLRDVAARPGGLIEALRLLDERTKTLSEEALAQVIPNIRAFRGVMNVLAQDAAVVDDVMGQVASGVDVLGAGMQRLAEEPGFQFQQFLRQAQVRLIEMGDQAVPAFKTLIRFGERLLDWAADAIDVFSRLPKPLQDMSFALVGIGIAAGPVVTIGGNLVMVMGGLLTATAKLSKANFAATLASWRIGFAAVTTAVGLLALKLNDLINKWGEASEKAMAYHAAQGNVSKLTFQLIQAANRGDIIPHKIFERANELLEEMRARLKSANAELTRLRREGSQRAIDAQRQEIESLNNEIKSLETALGRVEVAEKAVNDATNDATDGLDDLATSLDNAAIEAEELRRVVENLRQLKANFAEAGREAGEAFESALAERLGQVKVPTPPPPAEPIVVPFEMSEETWRIPDDYVDHIKQAHKAAWQEDFQAVTRRAWENVQDIAADTLEDILQQQRVSWDKLGDSVLKIFTQMLSKLLIEWAANAAKRIAIEQTVAAASSMPGGGGGGGGFSLGSLASLAGLFGGGGGGPATAAWPGLTGVGTTGLGGGVLGGGGGGGGAMAGAAAAWAIPLAIIGAIGYGQGWWGGGGPQTGGGTLAQDPLSGQLEVANSWGVNAGVVADKIRGAIEKFDGILEDIGLEVERFGEVIVEKTEGAYRISGAAFDALAGATAEEISEAIAVVSIRTAKFGDSVSAFLEAVLRGSQAITEQQLQAEVELARMVESFGKTDIQLDIEQIGRDMDVVFQEVVRLVSDNLEQLQFGLMQVAQEEISRWQAAYRNVTGQELSREQREEIMKANARLFEAEKALRLADLRARKAELEAERSMVQTRIEIGVHNLHAMRDVLEGEATLRRRWIRVSEEQLRKGAEVLNLQVEALDAVIAGLEALPTIDIDKLRLPGLGDAISETARDLERLQDLLEQSERQQLSDFGRALAVINDRWDEAIELAHGNAEQLERIAAARERETAALEQQALGQFWDDVLAFVGDVGQTDLGRSLANIDSQVANLDNNLGQLAEDLGLTGFDLMRFWEAIQDGARILRDEVLQRGVLDLLGGVANLIQDEQLRHQLLMRQAQIQFELQMAQHRMNFEILKAEGALAAETIAMLSEAFDWIQDNTDAILDSMAPAPTLPTGPGGGGPDPAQERADALRRLREIQARSLDPFSRAVRGVVDEFAELRRVLGWTNEVQSAYAQEIHRVLREQLEPIRRLQEDLAFHSGSPMRSIDQFRAAQRRLNDSVAALRGGDLSQVERIPELARRVLDLIPSSGASESRRFIFERIQAILDEAQQAAEAAVEGIEPGTASDPFAWLRDEPTAGDQAIIDAINDLGGKQDETTDAVEDVGDDIQLIPVGAGGGGAGGDGGIGVGGAGGGSGLGVTVASASATALANTREREKLRLLRAIEGSNQAVLEALLLGGGLRNLS